jgi:hypothetical protein
MDEVFGKRKRKHLHPHPHPHQAGFAWLGGGESRCHACHHGVER